MVMFSAILYGLMPMLARFSYAEGVNVITVLFYRYLFAFIMLTAYILIKRIKLRINIKQFVPIGIAALIGTVLTTYSLFLSYDYISTGLASTLHFIYPTFTCILALILYKEQLGKNKLIALLLSIVGISLLSLNNNIEFNVKGISWAIVSGLFYAIYIICAANKELKRLSPYVVAFYVFAISCTLFFTWGMISGELLPKINYHAIFYIGNLSFWATFVAVILFFVGMQQIGPGNAAILSTFEPLTGVILGLVIFHEQMDMNMLVGVILIILSVCLISKDKPRVVKKVVK